MKECEYCGEYHEEAAEESLYPSFPWPARCVDADDIRDRQLYDEMIEEMKLKEYR